MSRILVTDGEQRSSLAIVRSLGRTGHYVEVCAAKDKPLAGASRYARRSSRVPNPEREPDAYIEAIVDLLEEREIEILIPTTDASIELLLDVQERCPSLTIPQSPRPIYDRLSDKRLLTDIASDLGIAVPDQIVVESPDATVDADAFLRLEYPLVLKPARSSVRTAQGIRKQTVRIVASEEERVEAMRDLPPEAYPLLAQRRIVGPGKGLFMLTWDGQVYAAFGHRRLREDPPSGGISVYRESVPIARQLLDSGRALLEHVGWSGVAMIEFKEDAKSGIPYIMEVNARFWGSLQLAIDAGVDFPRMLVDLATGTPVEPVCEYEESVRSRWLWGDVGHLIGCLRAGASLRRALPDIPERSTALLRFLLPWRPGDRYEVLRLTDPKPFIRESIQWFAPLTD